METTTVQPDILSKEDKLERLNQLLDQANQITATYHTEPNFNSWKVSVEITLNEIFGNNSTQLVVFKKLNFHSPSSPVRYDGNETAHTHTEAFKRDFETAKLYLTQFKNSIDKLVDVPLTTTKEYLPKIQWQGTQKELGELFIELKSKGWIKEINAHLIQRYFTKSDTIHQVLKPSIDKTTVTATYDGVYTKAYRPRFDSIKTNPKET